MTANSTIHATGVIVGHRGILIRGPSGSGKSRLALTLLQSQGTGFVRLVGDDRLHLETLHGRLLMRPATALAGLLEVRGLGIVRLDFEPVAVAHLAIDLAAPDADRIPDPAVLSDEIAGVRLARLPVAPGADAFLQLLCFLQFGDAS
jgi:hypothetical protein